MKALKGTKTHENLKAAFAGESAPSAEAITALRGRLGFVLEAIAQRVEEHATLSRAEVDELKRRIRDRVQDLLDEWSKTADRQTQALMRSVNPAFIPRNHRIEAVIQAAVNNDYAPFEELLTALSKPYEDQPQFAAYAEPPLPQQRVTQTFCGT